MMTSFGDQIPNQLVTKYIDRLIGQFYKILPIKESGEKSLDKYMRSLQREMIGCSHLIESLNYDERFLSLISILQYMIDYECEQCVVKSEVFKAINLCKKLQEKYGVPEV